MLPQNYKDLSDKESIERIKKAKKKLGDKVFVLAHHYQRDEIVEIADAVGDSLKLSKIANETKAKYIIFCGVHFMAETADIVNEGRKIVILPDINAGCPMADMAKLEDVLKVWEKLKNHNYIPVTYINSTADIKAFCGVNQGYVCTSSNAEKVLSFLFKKKKKVMFLPDKNLGMNVALKLGLSKKEIAANLYLWNGFCPVHVRFKGEDIDNIKKHNPGIKILVHPEVPEEVAKKADLIGSTEFIVKTIETAPKGSKWAIGTEVHLVTRLAKNFPDKYIRLLSSPICMCSMMDRTSPQHVAYVLESLVAGKIVNKVQVEKSIAKKSLKAIKRMFDLS